MEAIGVQVLVIDEVHNILAGTYREQRIVLNTLRFLSNRLRISLVCFRVNEAREAIRGVQLARRFEQFTLSRWLQTNSSRLLVVSILRNTPLRQLILDRLDAVAAITGTTIKTATADAGYAYAKVFAV